MAHHGCKPEGWGKAVGAARAGLAAFWGDVSPELIIGWTAKDNRAALAFARRVGFFETGVLRLESGDVITQGWRP
jgi:RimJ/RimL family protein N-acetyltransferase